MTQWRRQIRAATAIGSLLVWAGATPIASAGTLPERGRVAVGKVDIVRLDGQSLLLRQASERAVVDWRAFDIGPSARVDVAQPGRDAVLLNRVTGDTPSTLAGTLRANGQVLLVNPNGIAITSRGVVEAAGFLASTLDIDNQRFAASGTRSWEFAGRSRAGVVNGGRIRAHDGGYVALLGHRVAQRGTIQAPHGRVDLIGGTQVLLDLDGDGFLQVPVSDATGAGDMTTRGEPAPLLATDGAGVTHPGRTIAPGGTVRIVDARTVGWATAQRAVRESVNVSGIVRADRMVARGGVVVLDGGAGEVAVSGRLAARGAAAEGGRIDVRGARVLIAETARLDASGSCGGGDVRLRAEAPVAAARGTGNGIVVSDGARLHADATEHGAGGRVALTSPGAVRFAGFISARGVAARRANAHTEKPSGGKRPGDGGVIALSGGERLAVGGTVDAGAAGAGRPGRTVFDSRNVRISHEADTVDADAAATRHDSVIHAATLSAALDTGDVEIVSTGGPDAARAGHIDIRAPVDWRASTTLSLRSAGGILFRAPVTASGDRAAVRLFPGAGRGYGFHHGRLSLTGAHPAFSVGTQSFTLIRDAAGLDAVRGREGGHYALARSIDMSAAAGPFMPIEGRRGQYLNRFEGLGNRVLDLRITQPDATRVGLFGVLGGDAVISHLELVRPRVIGHGEVGALVGQLKDRALVTGVRLAGAEVTATTPNPAGGRGAVGGLAGSATDDAHIVGIKADVRVNGRAEVGGLVGRLTSRARLTRVTAIGNVEGLRDVGGIVGGMADDSIVTDATWTGGVSGEPSGLALGGIVGRQGGGQIAFCAAHGGVYGGSEVGGVVGTMGGTAIAQETAAYVFVNGRNHVSRRVGRVTERAVVLARAALGDVADPDAMHPLQRDTHAQLTMLNAPSENEVLGDDADGATAASPTWPTPGAPATAPRPPRVDAQTDGAWLSPAADAMLPDAVTLVETASLRDPPDHLTWRGALHAPSPPPARPDDADAGGWTTLFHDLFSDAYSYLSGADG